MQKLLVFLLVTFTLATTTLAFSVEDSIATLAGFMAALIQKDNLKEMLTCATDAESISGDIEDVIADVESISFAGIFRAIITTGKIMGEAPFILRECENLQDDIQTITEQAEIFSNIAELTERVTKNYVWHYTEIMDDITKANQYAN